MAFHLFSTGKLIDGFEAQQAVPKLSRLTRLSEKKVHELLLNGWRRKLASKDDKETIEQYRDHLLRAGLAVEMVADEPEEAERPDNPALESEATPQKPSPTGRTARSRLAGRFLTTVTLLVAVVAVSAAVGWYWLNRPLSADALAVEAALADGSLVAIGHADVDRIVDLNAQWFGNDDPSPVPIPEDDKALMEELYSGKANFKENLDQSFFAVNAVGKGKGVVNTLVLTGRFEDEAIRKTLATGYEMTALGEGRWSLMKRPKQPGGFSCPEPKHKKKMPAPTPQYLHITPRWLVISGNEEQAEHVSKRLKSGMPAGQAMETWRSYRRGQLASLMIFIPSEASMSVDGIPGMVARKASKDAPHVSELAARVGIAPLSAGLQADLRLSSSDGEWNRDKALKLRQGIDRWEEDSKSISPSLVRLLSRISVEDSPERLEVGVDLDGEVLSEIGQTFREAMSRMFSVRSSSRGKSEGPVVDEFLHSPVDYGANAGFEKLPDYKPNDYGTPPLFIDGSFAANVESVKQNKEGFFELRLKGDVALPKSENTRKGELKLWVDEVVDAEGISLLRDERCVDIPAWSEPNHEPGVTSSTLFGDGTFVNKTIRLREGAVPRAIHSISGRLEFAAPIAVKRFPVPGVPGETVEHAGLRFFLGSIGEDGSVSFQLSGEKDRFLELRALNKGGKPLASDWMMGSVDKGRMTRHFKGNVKSVEVYIAERYTTKKASFTLSDIFVPAQSEKQSAGRDWFAPEAVSDQSWRESAALDIGKLHDDPKDEKWHSWDRQGEPIASMVQSPVAIDLTHKIQAWSNRPVAHAYFPQIPDLPGVLSALSYRVDEPARENTGVERYVKVHYPYYTKSGKVVVKHYIDGNPFARQFIQMSAGLEKEERLQRLKGMLRFRLPTETVSERIDLDGLWRGESRHGITITLTGLERGTFPGYQLKIEGGLERLVNVHGLGPQGERIAGDPINFQDAGYWTMTLPFTPGMESVELVLANKQKVYEYPFDFTPKYPK